MPFGSVPLSKEIFQDARLSDFSLERNEDALVLGKGSAGVSEIAGVGSGGIYRGDGVD